MIGRYTALHLHHRQKNAMGRHSKLTEAQWTEIERRILGGESQRKLADEYDISEAAIRKRLGARVKNIKEVANQIVDTEQKIAALPIGAQISAQNLAAKLRSISSHIASAADYGAMTAHRLAGIAHAQVEQIDDAAPLQESMEALRNVDVLTKMANSAGTIALNLLSANKEQAREANTERPVEDEVLPDDPVLATQTYLQLIGG